MGENRDSEALLEMASKSAGCFSTDSAYGRLGKLYSIPGFADLYGEHSMNQITYVIPYTNKALLSRPQAFLKN